MIFFDFDISILLTIFLVILSILGVFSFIVIRDVLFLVNFFNEQHKIAVYKKKFKAYKDEKKRVQDEKLQKDKEQIQEYGIDYVQTVDIKIIDFLDPAGKHSLEEIQKNLPKYLRIMKAAQSGQSLYWQSVVKLANYADKGRGRSM